MKKDKFILNILGNEADKEEYNHLESWIEEEKLATQDLIAMTQVWSDADQLKDYQSFDTDAALSKTLERIESRDSHNVESKAKKNFLPLIVVVSLLVLGFLGGFLYYSSIKNEAPTYYYAAKQNIINRADGTVISLANNAELKEWSSKNEYHLNGVASFDVTKQNEPLVIEVPQGAIKVIGTEFLVNAKDGQTSIDLYEGIVELSNEQGQKERLTQGNRAIIKNNQITITSFLQKDAKVSLIFENQSLNKIIDNLEQQFNVKIQYDLIEKDNLVTSVFLDETLDQILNELSLISGTQLSLKK